MRSLLNWWYAISLPQTGPDRSPAARERTRYRRLTSFFTLLMLIIVGFFMPFILLSAYNKTLVPVVAFIALGCIIVAFLLNKLGFNVAAASMLVLGASVNTMGTLLTRSLDPWMLPVMSILIIPLILAGSLMPPVAALIDAFLNSVFLLLIGAFAPHTHSYSDMMRSGLYFLTILLPVAIQIVVSILIYVIMSNLLATLRRADRAEEIVELQKSIAEFERAQATERENLEEAIAIIAQVHAEVARGNLNARVPPDAEGKLWQIAVPLNNLLNRVQQWKASEDQDRYTQAALHYAVQELQNARKRQKPVYFQQRTGTAVDPLLAEINGLASQTFSLPRSGRIHQK